MNRPTEGPIPSLSGPIVVLSGGYGGAKFTQGLVQAIARGRLPGHPPGTEVIVIANTADDLWLHGLKICPDLDTIMYTLGGGLDRDRGWGRQAETWSIAEELAAYDVPGTWFGLGDRDFATHIVRTQMLEAGYPLSAVTDALCRRWRPGVRLLPMSDDRIETHLAVLDPASSSGRRVVHFQEYWVRLQAAPEVDGVLLVGAEDAAPAPGVLEAIAAASVVVLPPSNPVVSTGPILAVPGVRAALAQTAAPIVGVSPIIAGDHVRGMARQLLSALGVAVDAGAVGLHYGARSSGGLLDGWLVDTVDAAAVPALEEAGIAARAVPLWMADIDTAVELAVATLGLAGPRA
ncbi:MAG: 2-phospho-L-lactate transferase [Nocardioides sp.]